MEERGGERGGQGRGEEDRIIKGIFEDVRGCLPMQRNLQSMELDKQTH